MIANVEERWRLEEGYRISVFSEQDAVSEKEVLDLWQREDVVPEYEAKRRIHEVLLVATHQGGELVGVSTAYLEQSLQLRMDLWYYRAYVAEAHRMSNVAVTLALMGREHLQQRYVNGKDPRGAGIVYEVENEGLKRIFDDAVWYPADVTFIGETRRGAHVRVRYFPGALAPEPTA